MLDSFCSRRLGFCSVAPSGRVQTLPRPKGGAHGRADQQVRLLLAEDFPGLLALGLDVEVPGLAVVRVVDSDVVLELAAVACGSLLTKGLDFFLVVRDLDAKASTLQESILLELLDNAFDDSLAESSGVYGSIFGDAAGALGV